MLTNNRIFIIEDNFMHREEVLDAVTQFSTRLDTSFDIEIIEDFTKFANNLSPKLVKDTDIYLLDIDLKSFFSGIDISEMIRKQNSNCFLIFITSLKDKGLEAINRGILPFAYILKDGHSFSEQVNTVLMNINEFSQSQPEQYLTVKDGANIARYEFSKILYFETLPQNRYNTLLVMTDGQYLLRGNIAKFKQMLKEREGFYSELRSYIIHTQMIRNIHYDTFTIQFVDKSELFLTYKTIQKVKKYLSRNGRQE